MTDPAGQRGLPLALLAAARPKQWSKNLLVFIGPGAAGVLDQPEQVAGAVVAFVAFCAAASGTYLLNDAADVEADRRHPVKRYRPIASGEVPVGLARGVGVVLLLASLAIAATQNPELVAVLGAYVVLTSLYTTWLKHIAVVDLAAIAAGFLLRAAGGAVAAEVPISSWFYIVASGGAVFVVAAKRLAELREGGDEAAGTRAALAGYSTDYLRYVMAVASGIAMMAYCLWAFEQTALSEEGAAWLELSAVPFVLGMMRYALLVDAGGGGEPEALVLGDRTLQVIGLCWAVVYGIGIYAQ